MSHESWSVQPARNTNVWIVQVTHLNNVGILENSIVAVVSQLGHEQQDGDVSNHIVVAELQIIQWQEWGT